MSHTLEGTRRYPRALGEEQARGVDGLSVGMGNANLSQVSEQALASKVACIGVSTKRNRQLKGSEMKTFVFFFELLCHWSTLGRFLTLPDI